MLSAPAVVIATAFAPLLNGLTVPGTLTVAPLVIESGAAAATEVVPVVRVKFRAPPLVPPESTTSVLPAPQVMSVGTAPTLGVIAFGSDMMFRLRAPELVPNAGS